MLSGCLALTDCPMHPEPVEAGVVRVTVIVEDTELHHPPPVLSDQGQLEGLHRVPQGRVGEVEQRGHRVQGVLLDTCQGHGSRGGGYVAVRGQQTRYVLCKEMNMIL